MRLSRQQRAIMLGIAGDLADYGSRTPRYYSRDTAVLTERRRIRMATEYGLVETDPSRWLGHSLTHSDYSMVSRNYKALERRGLIERHTLSEDSDHTRLLSLTPKGEAAAKALLAAQEATSDPNPENGDLEQ